VRAPYLVLGIRGTSYSFFVRWLFDKNRRSKAAIVWVPLAAAGISTIIVGVLDEAIGALATSIKGDFWIFLVVFVVALAFSARYVRHTRRALSPSWCVLGVPIAYHALSWAALLPTGAYKDRELMSLLVVIPVLLLLGIATFGWASLDRLFGGNK
jgi:hypothetical protein